MARSACDPPSEGEHDEEMDVGHVDGQETDSETCSEPHQTSSDDADSGVAVRRVRLAMWDMEHCDVKRCTGRKLANRGVLQVLSKKRRWGGVVLSPTGTKMLAPEDLPILLTHGLCVVDCSWNRLDEVPWRQFKIRHARILPFLLAANSTHYGQASELSCAEALAAALYIVGEREEAFSLLDGFSWGPEFFRLNHDVLARYTSCHGHEDVKHMQDTILMEREANKVSNIRKDVLGGNGWVIEEDEDGNILPPTFSNRQAGYSKVDRRYTSESDDEENVSDTEKARVLHANAPRQPNIKNTSHRAKYKNKPNARGSRR